MCDAEFISASHVVSHEILKQVHNDVSRLMYTIISCYEQIRLSGL